MSSTDHHYHNHTQKLNAEGKPLPDLVLKWGKSPPSSSSSSSPSTSNNNTTTTTTTTKEAQTQPQQKDPTQPDFSTYYTAEEQTKLRAKGINPTLKAEMEWNRKRTQGKGFWGKVAGTATGGGWIK